MRQVFADTFYWVALTDPGDPWYERAIGASLTLRNTQIITTEPVLIELLNYFSEGGRFWREQALWQAETILANPNVEVLPYHPASLRTGMDLYGARRDKGYSLTDCISMQEMRDRGIYEVLTHDSHLAQEGFVLLL